MVLKKNIAKKRPIVTGHFLQEPENNIYATIFSKAPKA